jgi:putative acetyltransferase
MAVLPSRQRAGIGSALVRAGLDECARLGFVAVAVLGHAEYYPRFGFLPASTFGLSSEFDVPDNVFLALELHPGALDACRGVIRYHPVFGSV